MEKTPVRTDAAPAPFSGAPYNQAIIAGDLVFVSGQGPLDKDTGKIVGTTTGEQAELTFDNLAAILEAAGSSLDRVVKTTVYLQDMADFPAMNEVYRARIGEPFPARTTIQAAGLPGGILVEIEAIALRG